MPDSLPLALGRARARLNATIAIHRALAWATPTAVAAGLLVAAARFLGLASGNFALWAALSLMGAAAGAFVARRSFLNEEAAARWLDARLDCDELLAAAISCLRRGAEGRFDRELLEKADELLPRAAQARVPRGPLAKQGAKASAALAIGAYLVFLSGTFSVPQGGPTARARAEAERGTTAKAASAAAALEEGGKAATAFASSLFPADRRMAMLTERALREGRLDDLRELLKAAGLDIDAKLAGSVSEFERKKLAREREKIGDAADALAQAAQARDRGAGGSSREGRGAGGEESRGQNPLGMPPYPYGGQGGGKGRGGSSDRGPGSKNSSPNAGSGGYEDEGAGAFGEGGEGKAGKGSQSYGVGSGSEGDWGDIEPLRGKGDMDIAAPKDPNFFELVLPGSEASRPVSDLVPSSRKSAEAAMSREGLPLEYEDFVRSYYLQLSKGESR